MIGARRTTAPLWLLALCVLLFLGRLFQIQVLAHTRWSEQAARLQHAGAVLPYRRGAILDASGRVLVRDREAYHLVFTYRSFRRGHPLGQVAHARAALLGRPVDLLSAWDQLGVWGRELVSISPAQLARFADGEPAELAGLAVPAGDPREERRGTRAADLHYYLLGLLGLTGSERLALVRARRAGEEQRSYAALVAAERGWDDASLVLYELEDRMGAARDALVRLSNELAVARQEPGGASALVALLEELDGRRVDVERRAASRLLSEVLGFAPGRVEPAALGEAVDLGWLERLLCWDEPTRARWLTATSSARSHTRLAQISAVQHDVRWL